MWGQSRAHPTASGAEEMTSFGEKQYILQAIEYQINSMAVKDTKSINDVHSLTGNGVDNHNPSKRGSTNLKNATHLIAVIIRLYS